MGFIKELWSDKIYALLYEDPDLQMMFNRSLETLVRTGGNKIHLPVLGASGEINISRTDNKSVGSGLPLTIKDIQKGDRSFEILEYSTDPFVIRNIDLVQSNPQLLQDKAEEIAQTFKEHIMTTAMTHIINNVAAANKLQWTGGTGGSKFAFADLNKMKTKLTNSKVLTNSRYLAYQSDEEDSLIEETGLQYWLGIQQTAIQQGRLPQLSGFGLNPTILSPKSKADGTISATAGENVKRNAIGWRKNHMHVVVQTEFEITASERAEYLGTVASFTNRYGVFLERDNGAVISTQQN